MLTKKMVLKLINTPSNTNLKINEIDVKLKTLENVTSSKSVSKEKGE